LNTGNNVDIIGSDVVGNSVGIVILHVLVVGSVVGMVVLQVVVDIVGNRVGTVVLQVVLVGNNVGIVVLHVVVVGSTKLETTVEGISVGTSTGD